MLCASFPKPGALGTEAARQRHGRRVDVQHQVSLLDPALGTTVVLIHRYALWHWTFQCSDEQPGLRYMRISVLSDAFRLTCID